MLTGKAKKEFEEWMDETYPKLNEIDLSNTGKEQYLLLPLSAQFGIIQEWLREKKLCVFIRNCKDGNYLEAYYSKIIKTDTLEDLYDSGVNISWEEAAKEAINKLNTIINE